MIKILTPRHLLLAASALALSACMSTQAPAPVVSGDSTTGSDTAGSTGADNPYGGTPYTPSDSTASGDNATPYTPSGSTAQPYQPAPSYGSGSFVPNYSPVDVNAATHRVQQGDTIYNISKRYGISQDNLRAWNNLPGDTLSIGQVLRVKPGDGSYNSGGTSSYAPASGSSTHRVVQGDTVYNIAKRYGISQNDLRSWNNLAGDSIHLGQTLVVGKGTSAAGSSYTPPPPAISTTTTSTVSTTPAPAPATVNQSGKTQTRNGITWQNPVPGGRISKSFTAAARGMEISGSRGQSVVSAADGQVIYSGVGPRGYGNLVVVQHNDKYLTAYGHNESLLVKEKQNVKRGQSLATMGSTGKLHFEIREDGSPVNPTQFVPF